MAQYRIIFDGTYPRGYYEPDILEFTRADRSDLYACVKSILDELECDEVAPAGFWVLNMDEKTSQYLKIRENPRTFDILT